MCLVRLVAPDEKPREAAAYDLEMSWVPMMGDTIEISCALRGDLRYRVIGRTIHAAFRADHSQAGEPIVTLKVEPLSSTTFGDLGDIVKRLGDQMAKA
jgi:hypothetical protein